MAENQGYLHTPSITDRTDIGSERGGRGLAYSELTAREKRDYLFEAGIRATAYRSGEQPDVYRGLIEFSESALRSVHEHALRETLTRVRDELEIPKRKLFHTYGTTAKIVFTPEAKTPYTGLFAQTAHGLARFSYAGPVIAIGVVPGLGLKFPLDGNHPSANLVVMRKLDRQQPLIQALSQHTHNSVFQNAFTNILPNPSPANVTMRVVKQRFETVVQDGRGLHQRVDNWATVRSDGSAVETPNSPHRLIFQPTSTVRDRSNPTIDFRDDLARNVPAGTKLYDVFALGEDQENELNRAGILEVEDLLTHARKIGAVATESEFIASGYGDYRLFFQHDTTYLRPASGD